MRRVLFRWRGITFWSYPAMLYCGMVAGLVAENLAAHAMSLDSWRVFLATVLLIAPAIAGARLLYVAAHWSRYRRCPALIWNRLEGGMTMYGGLPVMLLASIPVLAVLGVRFAPFWDAATFTILTGLIFAKFGCFLNGCCGGRIGRVPVQWVETGWAAVLLILASALLGRLPFAGALFLVVSAIYAAGRLVLDSFREHGSRRLGRAISIATAASALAILMVRWGRL